LLRISPNAFPATRYNTHKDPGDEAPVDYVQVRKTPHALRTALTDVDTPPGP
jgi:hypothetical protein